MDSIELQLMCLPEGAGWVKKEVPTDKSHPYPDDHHHEGTLAGTGAPVWHHSVPTHGKLQKVN